MRKTPGSSVVYPEVLGMVIWKQMHVTMMEVLLLQQQLLMWIFCGLSCRVYCYGSLDLVIVHLMGELLYHFLHQQAMAL